MAIIRYLNSSDTDLIKQAKQLWIECFDDSNEFTDYYFMYRTKPEYILCYIEDNVILGALHMLPKLLSVSSKVFDICLIAGVATKKAYRNKGIAHKLVNCANENAGAYATILQPANNSLICFYESMGYEILCKHERISIDLTNINTTVSLPDICITPSDLYNDYVSYVKEFSTYEVRTYDYFSCLLCEPDCFFVQYKSSYALCYDTKTECFVYELIGQSYPELLTLIKAHTQQSIVSLPSSSFLMLNAYDANKHDIIMIKRLKPLVDLGKIAPFLMY